MQKRFGDLENQRNKSGSRKSMKCVGGLKFPPQFLMEYSQNTLYTVQFEIYFIDLGQCGVSCIVSLILVAIE